MDTFSLVIKITIVMIFLSLAISLKWNIHQMNVSNAFLHGDLKEVIYMEQPQGFVNSRCPNYICKLHKLLYRLKQASRAWFSKFSHFLLSIDFFGSKTDTSLFFFLKPLKFFSFSFMSMTYS